MRSAMSYAFCSCRLASGRSPRSHRPQPRKCVAYPRSFSSPVCSAIRRLLRSRARSASSTRNRFLISRCWVYSRSKTYLLAGVPCASSTGLAASSTSSAGSGSKRITCMSARPSIIISSHWSAVASSTVAVAGMVAEQRLGRVEGRRRRLVVQAGQLQPPEPGVQVGAQQGIDGVAQSQRGEEFVLGLLAAAGAPQHVREPGPQPHGGGRHGPFAHGIGIGLPLRDGQRRAERRDRLLVGERVRGVVAGEFEVMHGLFGVAGGGVVAAEDGGDFRQAVARGGRQRGGGPRVQITALARAAAPGRWPPGAGRGGTGSGWRRPRPAPGAPGRWRTVRPGPGRARPAACPGRRPAAAR